MTYDSSEDARRHIREVITRLEAVCEELRRRGELHDKSKFDELEKRSFDEVVPRLKGLRWESDEYREEIRALGPALIHHYAHNRHHPEHYANGVSGMDLVDVIEMYCDWAAATLRHEGGDLLRSIEVNVEKHEITEPLAEILRNTWRRYGGFCGEPVCNRAIAAQTSDFSKRD